MSKENVIKGNTEDEIWQQINQQFEVDPEPLDYTAIIEIGSYQIILNIDIDLGGGFESGYETTSFIAPININNDFRFAIHEQHFTDEIGKFFGMQDVVIGYEEFDKRLIIKTNNEAKVKEVFANSSTRTLFEKLSDYTFGITTRHTNGDTKAPVLELIIQTGITDVQKLREVYLKFYNVLSCLDKGIEKP